MQFLYCTRSYVSGFAHIARNSKNIKTCLGEVCETENAAVTEVSLTYNVVTFSALPFKDITSTEEQLLHYNGTLIYKSHFCRLLMNWGKRNTILFTSFLFSVWLG